MRSWWTMPLMAGLGLVNVSSAAAADPPELLTLEVAVMNEAGLSQRTVGEAQVQTERIYARLFIAVVWTEFVRPLVPGLKGPPRLTIRLVAQSKLGLDPTAMGFAIRSVNLAYIFSRQVEDFSKRRRLSVATVLGHTIAHEMGHLLMWPYTHSPSGLMRRNWDRERELASLRNTERGLAFTRDEGMLIRAAVEQYAPER